MVIKLAPLTIQGVGQDSDGGFLEKVAAWPSGEGRFGDSFEAANEAAAHFQFPMKLFGPAKAEQRRREKI